MVTPRVRRALTSALTGGAGVAAAAVLVSSASPEPLPAQPIRAPAGVTPHRPADNLDPIGAARGARSASEWTVGAVGRDVRLQQDTAQGTGRAPWWAALASAIVPGSGQAVLRQPYGIAYTALDVYMLLEYRQAKRFLAQQREEYLRNARDVARRVSVGARPDGSWDYYEQLEKLCIPVPLAIRCPSSGVYDVMPGGDLDPETDINTFNGQTWARARDLFWDDSGVAPPRNSPAYNNAIAYYTSRAVRPEFYWSWVDQQQAQDEYRRTIASANAAKRDATRDLSIIAANHVLSMVDAFVTVRIRRYGGSGRGGARRSGFEASIPWSPFGGPSR
jgi:hypothetical protein